MREFLEGLRILLFTFNPISLWLGTALVAYVLWSIDPLLLMAVLFGGMFYGLYRMARSISRDNGGGAAHTLLYLVIMLGFIGLLALFGSGDDAGIPYRGM